MAKYPPRRTNQEDFLSASLDKKNRYEGYLSDIDARVLPILQRALNEGWSRDKLLSDPTIGLLMAARQVSIAISEVDSSKALASIRDVSDRVHGRPTEKIETTHKLASMSDEQLDALLLSKIGSKRESADEDESDIH